MNKISINLLPAELTVNKKEQAKFKLVQKLGGAVVIILIFLATVVVSLRIFQTGQINKVKSDIIFQEGEVGSLKSKETALAVLKNRVTLINEIVKSSADQPGLFNEVNSMVPAGVVISAFTIDPQGNVLMAVTAADRLNLSALLDNLTQSSETSFKKVTVENLNRSRDGEYRANFSIQAR